MNDDPWAELEPVNTGPKVVPFGRPAGMDDRPFAPPGPEDAAPNQFREISDKERDAIPMAPFRPWAEIDLSAIPYPEFVYGDFYARGYTSLTIAPPKVGKSMLGLAEAIDIATGRGILTGHRREPQTVVYFNAEDDQNVINARVSALLELYQIPQRELVNRFYPTSGVDMDNFFLVSGQEGVINERLFIGIEKFITGYGADALIFDPLQDLSRSPETNEVFRILGQRLRRLASSSKVALGIIHHTRKTAPGVSLSIDDARGGGALRGTARFNRLLVPMTEDEAKEAGVLNHRHFFRIGDVESNLAPPSAEVNQWFEKVSVLAPNSKHVGAVKRWEFPDAFDGISRKDLLRVQNEVERRCNDGRHPRADAQTGEWVGYIVAEFFGLDAIGDGRRIKKMVAEWVKSGALRKTYVVDDGRKKRPAYEVGEWATE